MDGGTSLKTSWIARGAAALTLAVSLPLLAGGDPVAAAGWQDREGSQEDGGRPAAFAVARFTAPTLTRFASEAEFDAYLAALRAREAEQDALDRETARRGPIRFAQAPTSVTSDAAQPPVCSSADDPLCQAEQEVERPEYITVTGSRISARNASITNNQMQGVDEGDIVKQIGRHLLILSDGRIFVIDTRPRGRPGLALVDRIDVYRDPEVDTWYDEMLVFEDRVIVAGYSYDAGETELSVFRLAPDGRLSRDGVFTRRSNDYYSPSNYATRLVGDSLVLYSLFDIDDMDEDEDFGLGSMQQWAREPENAAARPRRRRSEEDEGEERAQVPAGAPLLDANAIYRPVRTESEPSVHAISICPLGAAAAAAALPCRSTAFVGPEVAQWYVTADETVLWAHDWDHFWDADCISARPPLDEVLPAVLFRIPHGGSEPGVAGARGEPFDQFSMQVNDARLRALVDRTPQCDRDADYAEPLYVETPLAAFGPSLREIGAVAYADVPNPGTPWIVNRFTERHLVYGGLSRYRTGLPEIDWDDYEDDPRGRAWRRESLARPPAFVVPAGRPGDVARLDIGHTAIRAERYGANDVVLTGYRDRRGLSVSLIDLDGRPRIGSTLELEGRFESEGRSHAFNSLVEHDGTGMIGLPTSPRRRDSRRSPAHSRASDVSFLSVGRGDLLGDLGLLSSRLVYAEPVYDPATGEERNEDGLEGYECEVSCIDWYGNSRPIFTDGRIFALTGGELIEGRRGENRMIEIRRIDFLRAPVPRR
jgi:hypothetical protein